jgi:hypothetical protein
MLPVDEIIGFSVNYINRKEERTLSRKRKIRKVYRELFGRDIKGSCSTCYIEALLEIVKTFKRINMATPNYELKRGVLLESFGHPEKTCTNDSLTDELAEWHLRQCPEKAIYFARTPGGFVTNIPAPPPPQTPPPAPSRNFRGEGTIIEPEKIVYPPSQEDPIKRKVLFDRALELGFKSAPESPIELIKSDELNVIILNLEKAKEKPAEVKTEIKEKKKPVKKPKTKK